MNNIKIAKELIKIAKDLIAFDDFGYSFNEGYIPNLDQEQQELYYVAIQTDKVDTSSLNQMNNKNDKKFEQNSIEEKKDKAVIIGLAKPNYNSSADILKNFNDATSLYKEIKSYLEKQCNANFKNKNFKKVQGDVIREGNVEQSEICYYLNDQDIERLLDKFFDKIDNPCEFL